MNNKDLEYILSIEKRVKSSINNPSNFKLYTEEDMKKAMNYGNGIGEHKDMTWYDFIQSLSQPKLPTQFNTETNQYIY